MWSKFKKVYSLNHTLKTITDPFCIIVSINENNSATDSTGHVVFCTVGNQLPAIYKDPYVIPGSISKSKLLSEQRIAVMYLFRPLTLILATDVDSEQTMIWH